MGGGDADFGIDFNVRSSCRAFSSHVPQDSLAPPTRAGLFVACVYPRHRPSPGSGLIPPAGFRAAPQWEDLPRRGSPSGGAFCLPAVAVTPGWLSPGPATRPARRPQTRAGLFFAHSKLMGLPAQRSQGALTMSHLTLAESAQEPNRDRDQCSARPQSGRDGA